MIILGKPKELDDYICVDSELGLELHKFGFIPLYRWQNNLYFVKNDAILKVVKEIEK